MRATSRAVVLPIDEMKAAALLALAALLAACASAPELSSIGGASAEPAAVAPAVTPSGAAPWPPATQPLRDEEDRDERWF